MIQPSAPARIALMLPGADCCCVKASLDHGIITPETLLIAVEREPDVFAVMADNLERLHARHGLREPLCILNELHHISLHFLPRDMAVDFAFLDFCGTFSAEILYWIRWRLAPRLSSGATLAFTQMYGERGNAFFGQCERVLNRELTTLRDDPVVSQGIREAKRWVPLAQLRAALENHRWESGARAIRYGDEQPMVVIPLFGLERRLPERSDLLETLLRLSIGERELDKIRHGFQMSEEAVLRSVETRKLFRLIRDRAEEKLATRLESLGSELSVAEVMGKIRQKDPSRVLAGLKSWETRRQRKL